VASFIGSPAMNFLPGTVQAGVFRFHEGSNGEAPPAAIQIADAVPDGAAILGIRPEDLIPGGDGASLGMVVLEIVEQMGHETIAHFSLTGNSHVARLPANAAVQPGDRLPLAIRPGAVHVFSAQDGRRLN
jgi:multiple sugar transport system ATP-binding protein